MSDTAVLPTPRSAGLHAGLWAAQVALALLFLASGGTKVTAPIADLRAQMPWVDGALGGAVRFIGVAEVLGAIGLVLPAATRIFPFLTPLAAAGLWTVMALAAVMHLSRGEVGVVAVNVVIGGIAAFVAWGRAGRAAIAAR